MLKITKVSLVSLDFPVYNLLQKNILKYNTICVIANFVVFLLESFKFLLEVWEMIIFEIEVS